jgi:hypothetical protein
MTPLQFGIPGGPELVIVNLLVVVALVYIAYRVLID